MQVCEEKTIFMQKAIYYVTKLVAARGVLELTDRNLNFQVSNLDSSFGIRSVSIDIDTISDVKIAGGNLNPAVIVTVVDKKYEFVLQKVSEMYDCLKELRKNSVRNVLQAEKNPRFLCECGKEISREYRYCPWCGKRV